MAHAPYSLLIRLAAPFAALRLAWRNRAGPPHDDLGSRLGLRLQRRADAPLWVHGASVGELRAIAALLHALPQAPPVLVTSGTPTGCARAWQMFGAAGHTVQLAPWDLPGATRRFVRAAQPRALVIIETELWPNLIAAVAAAGVPMALLSARLSERSLRRYLRLAPATMRGTIRAFDVIGAQSGDDRERFIRLGADPARVQVTGNLKFDVPLDPDVPARGAALRARCAPRRPLWVAGSTHAGEEAVLLAAQRRVVEAARQAARVAPLLAIAPRHPDRFDAVARWLQGQGVGFRRTAEDDMPGTATADAAADVVLIDQMGVLPEWYAAADVTFVGGSLVPVGGHNLLEPAALARPVLCGPHTFSAPDVARALLGAGGAAVVCDAEDLASRLQDWFSRDATRAAAGANAAAAVAANQGAARRAAGLLTALGWSSAPSATG